jgi:hypothetical protein
MYQKLRKELINTRRSFIAVCDELDIDPDEVDYHKLKCSQCNHCNVWAARLIEDLDGNEICKICYNISGL